MLVSTLLPQRIRFALWALLHNVRTVAAALSSTDQPIYRSELPIPPGTYAPPARPAPALTARPPRPVADGSPRHRVVYQRSGATLEVEEKRTLLEAALEAGLPLRSACRMGLCGTCKTRLLEGRIVMAEPNALSDAERAAGLCLPCISRPRGPVKLDA